MHPEHDLTRRLAEVETLASRAVILVEFAARYEVDARTTLRVLERQIRRKMLQGCESTAA